ncbi:cytochrome b561 and DOMON domain-containing protein At5g47530-like [Zingiber officinale]|uniref:cytochrome b561 and DOMON domain-containing protein At5g47530-like n=1 Tax=Zingiber officinale TaxID=94328 RepID=UPI001C4AA3A5|nr:cytochrome b561 and DOMON domain-containing protein At5g47530-like [Zingiber officinale]
MKLAAALLVLCFLCSLQQRSGAQSCNDAGFSDGMSYEVCNPLSVLNSVLHYTYHASNGTVDIAYRAWQSASGWVAWAINPDGVGMIGANAFLAFHNGSSVMLYTTVFTNTNPAPSDITDGNLTFTVHSRMAEYSSAGGYYTIYASLDLPRNRTSQSTVWQASTSFSGSVPFGHAYTGNNIISTSTMNFLSGQSTSAGGIPRLHRKNIHGVVNAISWGILLPIGAIIARYMKVFKSADPAWFYLHVACQCSGYIIGLSGWILGLQLGSDSKGITYHKHRNLGIAIFTLATVQVFALFLRPNKDHKHRLFWNIYHYAIGYGVIVMSIVNIFEGFDILDPEKKWKNAYIAIIATLGAVALALEAVTWPIVIIRRSSDDKAPHAGHGENGYA